MKVLIGGGTGFIGRHLKAALVNRGHDVKVISRTRAKDRYTWQDLEYLKELPKCDALINLSGEYILNFLRFWNEDYKKDVYDSRIGTNKKLVKLMTEGESKPKVWISTSAEGFYPRTYDETFDETFTWKANSPHNYAQTLCIDWENSSLLQNNANIRHVNIRLGVVLGKHGGLIQQSWLPFSLGLGGSIGHGQQYLPWIHIKDVANLYIHAIENNNVDGHVNAISPNSCTINEFTKAFGKSLNRPTIFTVPEFAINFLAGQDRAPFMLEGSRIVPKKAIETDFNFQFENIQNAMDDIVNQ